MAVRIIKKPIVKPSKVITITKNTGNTPEGNLRSIKKIKK